MSVTNSELTIPLVPTKLKRCRPKRGAHLTALRTAARLTQVQLGGVISETQQNVAAWERSEYPPSADLVPKLAKALGVRIEYVLDIETTSPRPRRRRSNATFEKPPCLARRQHDRLLETVEVRVAQQERSKWGRHSLARPTPGCWPSPSTLRCFVDTWRCQLGAF